MRRIILALIIVFLVSFAIFILMRMLPGDPIEMIMSATQLENYTQEQIDAIRHEKGLDKPVLVQYVIWLGQMLRGDFGNSIVRNFNVASEMSTKITVTMIVGLSAFLLGLIIGPLLGIISAVRRGKFIDNLVTVIANIGITVPTFWLGIIMIFFLGLRLKILPLFGYTFPWDNLGMSIKQSIMPIFVLALGPIAFSARQMRASVLEVLGEDYTRTGWAKGLNERKVIWRHVIKNAMMPVITLQGTMLRNVIGGAVVVETVFVVPGMGKFLVDGILSRDYPVVQAVTVVMTIIVVLSNLLVDLLYGWVDPRIQYE
ncbi:MAG: ABC transporter permease [Clostridiales bacterium]|nr:ABC transporter permease [Clostridiales bacterium]